MTALLSAPFKELIGGRRIERIDYSRLGCVTGHHSDNAIYLVTQSIMSNRLYSKRGIALDLQQLQTFQMVAATGSFTRAAAALGYSQSNVTHQIKNLENRLGAALFDRQRFSRGAVLTQAGRRVLGYSQRILDLAHGLLSKDSIETSP